MHISQLSYWVRIKTLHISTTNYTRPSLIVCILLSEDSHIHQIHFYRLLKEWLPRGFDAGDPFLCSSKYAAWSAMHPTKQWMSCVHIMSSLDKYKFEFSRFLIFVETACTLNGFLAKFVHFSYFCWTHKHALKITCVKKSSNYRKLHSKMLCENRQCE